jgi:hypothetical protein
MPQSNKPFDKKLFLFKLKEYVNNLNDKALIDGNVNITYSFEDRADECGFIISEPTGWVDCEIKLTIDTTKIKKESKNVRN